MMASPEDRLAGLLARLDQLPRAARRPLTLVIPLALVAALVASLTLVSRSAPHDGTPAARHRISASPQHPASTTSQHPGSTTPETPGSTPPAAGDAGGDVGARPEVAAVDPARAFVESYLAVAYGHARTIRGAAPAFARSLTRQRARVSPAQRRRHPRVVALRVSEFSPGVAQATAVIADGAVRYHLMFLVDRRAGGWLVTRMGD